MLRWLCFGLVYRDAMAGVGGGSGGALAQGGSGAGAAQGGAMAQGANGTVAGAHSAAAGDAGAAPSEGADGASPAEARRFSQGDMDRLAQRLRSEFSRRRDREVADALRAAGLDDAAQASALADARAADLDAREADISRRELRASALDALERIGLPPSLADALNYTDPQSLQASMEAIERAFRPALQEGIEQRLRGNTPPKAGAAPSTGRVAAYRAALGLPK